MRRISTVFLGLVLVLVATTIPLSASAQFTATGISFGGRVVTVLPCLSVLGPSLHVTIVPAGVFPTMYIWTPATITKLVGPPVPGGQILGKADVPFACWNLLTGGFLGLFPVFSFLYGLRMQEIGTSLPGV